MDKRPELNNKLLKDTAIPDGIKMTPELEHAIAVTEVKQRLRMENGEEETLTPMTREEFEMFLTEEDARYREEVGYDPDAPPRHQYYLTWDEYKKRYPTNDEA